MFDPLVIAIVDDDEAVREAFCDLLQVVGLQCRSFDRAEAFLDGYLSGIFGCVITDMRMPGISGLELLERIKAMDSAMPVIVVTSHWDPLIRSRTLEGGAHAFLTKPVAEDTLLQHLRSALGRADLSSSADGGEPSDG